MKQDSDLQGFLPLLFALRQVKRPVAVAPTHIPQNFWEQFELYENAGTYRLYVYLNAWRYVALT